MINYLETHIVDHCNLNCKGCSHFSPLAKQTYKDINKYEEELDRLNYITNSSIRLFRIMGGEPLLHPQMVDFCVLTRNFFPKATIVLVSNGTLLRKLSDEDIQKLNELHIDLNVSDYGVPIDMDKFNKFNCKYFYNKNKMYNIGLDLNGMQDINYSYYNCDHVQQGCNFLKDGRIYQCAISAQIDYFNEYFNTNIKYDLDDISIDIFSHTEQEIKQFLSTPHNFCKYCNIKCRQNSLAPFQISKKEITEWISQ